MKNIERIRAAFPDHEFDIMYVDEDTDDVELRIDGISTSIYDFASDILADDTTDYEILYEEVQKYLHSL